jgi:hypothetical protein
MANYSKRDAYGSVADLVTEGYLKTAHKTHGAW